MYDDLRISRAVLVYGQLWLSVCCGTSWCLPKILSLCLDFLVEFLCQQLWDALLCCFTDISAQ